MTELAETQTETPPQEPPAVDKTHTFPFTIEEALPDDESETLKNRLVVLDRAIMSVNDEKKKANKGFADRLKTLTGEHEQVLGSIEVGTVKREVLCYEERDDRMHRILTRRVDTDAIVDERPLDDDDEGELAPASATRQTDMFDAKTPEEMAEDAEAEGRVVRTTSAEARRRADERKAMGNGEDVPDDPAEEADDDLDDEDGDAEEDDETA